MVPFDADQVELAHAGFVRYGKGRHPAALNLGDLYAYADSFGRTDATPA